MGIKLRPMCAGFYPNVYTDRSALTEVQLGCSSLSAERIEKLIHRNPLPELGLA
jgi:hypothetical protein